MASVCFSRGAIDTQVKRPGATMATTAFLLSDESEKRRAAWERVIDEKLIEWGNHPERFEEDGLDPPSKESIRTGCLFAAYLRDDTPEVPVPNRVMPTGDGGIVFEYRSGKESTIYEIDETGLIEKLQFDECRLTEQRIPGQLSD